MRIEAGEVQSIIQRADLADVHHVVGIHGGRQIAFEPRPSQPRIGAVAETGQRQRTIKRDFDTCGAIDQDGRPATRRRKACAWRPSGLRCARMKVRRRWCNMSKHTEPLAPSPLLVRHAGVTRRHAITISYPQAQRPELAFRLVRMMARRARPCSASDKSDSETVAENIMTSTMIPMMGQ